MITAVNGVTPTVSNSKKIKRVSLRAISRCVEDAVRMRLESWVIMGIELSVAGVRIALR